MARVCAVTGKKTATGHNRPWSKKATKRTFKVNMMNKRMLVDGKMVNIKVSAKGLKTLKKRAQRVK